MLVRVRTEVESGRDGHKGWSTVRVHVWAGR
jgi:hypothetical protein